MKIGFYGSAALDLPPEFLAKSREIGSRVAQARIQLVNGACPGHPYSAALGAVENDGEVVGYSPASDAKSHRERFEYPEDGVTIWRYLPDFMVEDPDDNEFGSAGRRLGRNYLSTKYVANRTKNGPGGIILVAGDIGTHDEFSMSMTYGVPVGLLIGSGGVTDHEIPAYLERTGRGGRVIKSADPEELVEKLIAMVRESV